MCVLTVVSEIVAGRPFPPSFCFSSSFVENRMICLNPFRLWTLQPVTHLHIGNFCIFGVAQSCKPVGWLGDFDLTSFAIGRPQRGASHHDVTECMLSAPILLIFSCTEQIAFLAPASSALPAPTVQRQMVLHAPAPAQPQLTTETIQQVRKGRSNSFLIQSIFSVPG